MTLNHFVLHTEFQDITYKDTLTRFQLYHETFIGPEVGLFSCELYCESCYKTSR